MDRSEGLPVSTQPEPEAETESHDLHAVVAQFYDPLHRFAISLVRCGTRAEDLTQETILIFVRRGHQVRDRTKIRQWLFTTLWREHLRELRRGERVVRLLDFDTLAHPDGPSDAFGLIDPARLQRALDCITPKAREILQLRYFRGLSYPSLARELRVPAGTVMSRLFRAHRALKDVLLGGAVGSGIKDAPRRSNGSP